MKIQQQRLFSVRINFLVEIVKQKLNCLLFSQRNTPYWVIYKFADKKDFSFLIIVCLCTKVYEYLDCVTSYTELLRENQLGDVDCSGDNKIWRIVTSRLLYKSGKNEILGTWHTYTCMQVCLLCSNHGYM